MLYEFVGKKGQMYKLNTKSIIKLNYKCEFNGTDYKCDNINPEDALNDLKDQFDNLLSNSHSDQQLIELNNNFKSLVASKKLDERSVRQAARFIRVLDDKINKMPNSDIKKPLPTQPKTPVVSANKKEPEISPRTTPTNPDEYIKSNNISVGKLSRVQMGSKGQYDKLILYKKSNTKVFANNSNRSVEVFKILDKFPVKLSSMAKDIYITDQKSDQDDKLSAKFGF